MTDAKVAADHREEGAFATLGRGLRMMPEFRRGLPVTFALALIATAGRVVVPIAVQQVIEAADAGDERCATAVDEVAFWTGIGLANVVTAFDPRVIVVAGVLDQVWRARPGVVRDGISHSSRIALLDEVDVRSAGLGEDSPLIGAAELAVAPLLADPTGPPLEASG